MSEILQFANANPVTAFLMTWVAAWAFQIPFRLFFRHMNIRSAGWPPDYLDADGDYKRGDDTDDTDPPMCCKQH